MLPSGLPDEVGDQEPVSRFLTQSGHYNSSVVRPSAFMPHPERRNTSVFRIGNEPGRLKQIYTDTDKSGRTLHGAGILSAKAVRGAEPLDLEAHEPPLAHANIEKWPWPDDVEDRRSRHKELATLLASASERVLLE